MSREQHNEEQAFFSLRQGEEKGLSYYYRQYDTALVYFALRVTGDEAAAEDIVSEAFVKFWGTRETLSHPKAVKPYLYQVVRNAAIDFVRRRKRESLHLQQVAHLQETAEEETTSFEISAETHRLIYASIESLPPRCGTVFRMFYLERKTLPQIAAELGLSVNTVRNQKMQALTILRKAFPLVLLVLRVVSEGKL